MSTEVTTVPQPRTFGVDNMITLLVGPEEQHMTVHREFLSQDSKFFQAALKKEWVEGQSREIKLPEELPIHIGYYIEHMHGLALPTHVFTKKPQFPDGTTGPQFELLAELYVLGERRLDAKYQNKIMHEFFRIVEVSKTYPGVDCVNALFRGTTRNSPARRMVVDYAAYCTNAYWPKYIRDDVPDAEFFRDLSVVFLQRMARHTLVSEIRGGPLKVEDYLVSEDAGP
jgi:hypothetical protein